MPMPEYWLHPDESGLPVRVTGAMLKKGGSRGGRRNWTKRWFVLEPALGRLRYFEDPSLMKESGIVCLVGSTEINTEAPVFKGRHGPLYEGEDAYYMELVGAVDGEGRQRPYSFAMRAFSQTEYDEWLRSLKFSIRKSEQKKEVYGVSDCTGNDLKVAKFDQPSLGLSLSLSRGSVTGTTMIVVSKIKSGGPAAEQQLQEDDQLIAIHPPENATSSSLETHPLLGAQPLPKEVSVADFEAILASLRAAPRPIALVFKTTRRKTTTCEEPSAEESDSALQDMVDFYVMDDLHHTLDPVDFATLQTRWHDGTLNRNTAKLFVADVWIPFSSLPALVKRLDDTDERKT